MKHFKDQLQTTLLYARNLASTQFVKAWRELFLVLLTIYRIIRLSNKQCLFMLFQEWVTLSQRDSLILDRKREWAGDIGRAVRQP